VLAWFFHAPLDLLEVLGDCIEDSHLVEQSLHAAFAARAVVSLDIDHQHVLQFPQILDGIEDAAHLMSAWESAAA
jgi:hypothetical protein